MRAALWSHDTKRAVQRRRMPALKDPSPWPNQDIDKLCGGCWPAATLKLPDMSLTAKENCPIIKNTELKRGEAVLRIVSQSEGGRLSKATRIRRGNTCPVLAHLRICASQTSVRPTCPGAGAPDAMATFSEPLQIARVDLRAHK